MRGLLNTNKTNMEKIKMGYLINSRKATQMLGFKENIQMQ